MLKEQSIQKDTEFKGEVTWMNEKVTNDPV